MLVVEPGATALLFTTVGVLLAASALFSRASSRAGVPVALVFLLIGVAAGSEGIGGIPFDNYGAAYRLGTAALVLILFDGGLNTPASAIRQALGPAGVLATVGVVGTAALVGAAAHLLGLAWPYALLLGAVVSSTDAASVFSMLRGNNLTLKRRVGNTLEVESGINDPVAVLLTSVLTRNAMSGGPVHWWALAGEVVLEVLVGAAVGLAVGYGARLLLTRVRLQAGGLYPVEVVDWRVVQVEHSWAGLRSFAPDRLPVYGFARGSDDFFWCAGQGGFGIQTAPAAAQLAAAMLLGHAPGPLAADMDPAPYQADRFTN